jgi:beta-glucosidase
LRSTFPARNTQGPAQTTAEYPGDGTNVYYDEGLLVGYRWYDAKHQQPLFPFGYGLSYTSFRINQLDITRSGRPNTVTVTATVTNTGSRPGAEVAQLYLGSPSSAKEPPRQLKGYQKVALAPGRSKQVRFTLTDQDLASWDNPNSGWTVHPGSYRVWVGDSSSNTAVSGQFTISS